MHRNGELGLAIEEEDHDGVEADRHVVLAVQQGGGRLPGPQEHRASYGGHDQHLACPELVQELVPVCQDALAPHASLESLPAWSNQHNILVTGNMKAGPCS